MLYFEFCYSIKKCTHRNERQNGAGLKINVTVKKIALKLNYNVARKISRIDIVNILLVVILDSIVTFCRKLEYHRSE